MVTAFSVPKKILYFFVVVAVALVGATLSINLIIQSASVQEELHQQAEKILGLPITMGKLSFNPFTGFHLSNVAITNASGCSVEIVPLDFMPTWKLLLSRHWSHLEKWGGILRAGKVTLNHSFFLEHLKAHFKKRATNLLIDPFSSQVADGKLTGSFLLQQENNGLLVESAAGDEKQGVVGAQQRSVYENTRAASTDTTQLVAPAVGLCKKSNLSPYQLNIHFSDISLKELMKGTQSVEGKMQGTFFMKGILEDDSKKEGEGMLEVLGMKFKPGGPLAQIGQLLGIQELQLLQFSEAVATYAITPRDLIIKSFKLRSNNLIVRGHGTISFEGKLHLSALLLMNVTLQSRLQGLLPVAMLVPSGELGYVALPFEITGSLDHPHSTLLEHVPLPAINSNVQGVIRQLLKF